MSAPDPLKRFEAEHDEALQELDRLEAAVAVLERGEAVRESSSTVRQVHSFLATAVRRHNENEELALFPFIRDSLPVTIFEDEHVTLRNLESDLLTSIDAADIPRMVEVSRSLIELLRSHIERENEVLFPASREHLGEEGLNRVAAELEKSDKA